MNHYDEPFQPETVDEYIEWLVKSEQQDQSLPSDPDTTKLFAATNSRLVHDLRDLEQRDARRLARIRERLVAHAATSPAPTSLTTLQDVQEADHPLPPSHEQAARGAQGMRSPSQESGFVVDLDTEEIPVLEPATLRSRVAEQKQRSRAKHVSRWVQALAAVLILGALIGSFATVLVMHKAGTSNPGKSRAGTPTAPTASVPLYQNPILSEIQMTSANIGWGKGVSAKDPSTRIVARTVDGGKTWQELDIQGQAPGLISSFFLDDQTAWVTLDSGLDPHTQVSVMHTIDGGLHWTALHFPPLMSNYTFLDQQHGWAWDSECLSGVPESCALYKTIDGGTTWRKPGTLSTGRSFSDSTPGLLPINSGLNMTFLTPQHGWAILHSPQNDRRAFLYMTQDGGTTWQLQDLPQPATGPIPGIHTVLPVTSPLSSFAAMSKPKFFTPQRGVLSISSQVGGAQGSGSRNLYLYATNDGGRSWSPLGTRIENASGSLFSAEIPDPTHLLLWSNKTLTVYALVNNQWQKQSTSQIAGEVGSFSFVSAQRGWIYTFGQSANGGEFGILYATSDGGKSWHAVMQTITTKPQQGG